jgi:hypothetical protein
MLLVVTVVLVAVQDTRLLRLVVLQLAVKETTVVTVVVQGSVLLVAAVLGPLVKTHREVVGLRLVEMVYRQT